MKNLLLTTLISFALVAQAKELPDELAESGTVVSVGTCTVNKTKYNCLKVLLKGEEFLVAGTARKDGFYVQYVSKLMNGKHVIVWVWTPKKPKVTL